MHPVIKEILDNNMSNKEKAVEIEKLKASIEIIEKEKILNGECIYCKNCGDYFLSKSFIKATEIVEESVCTYSDPYQSTSDVYEKKLVRYTYMYCPKGCKHQIKREECW